jgi:hypothetical protein
MNFIIVTITATKRSKALMIILKDTAKASVKIKNIFTVKILKILGIERILSIQEMEFLCKHTYTEFHR